MSTKRIAKKQESDRQKLANMQSNTENLAAYGLNPQYHDYANMPVKPSPRKNNRYENTQHVPPQVLANECVLSDKDKNKRENDIYDGVADSYQPGDHGCNAVIPKSGEYEPTAVYEAYGGTRYGEYHIRSDAAYLQIREGNVALIAYNAALETLVCDYPLADGYCVKHDNGAESWLEPQPADEAIYRMYEEEYASADHTANESNVKADDMIYNAASSVEVCAMQNAEQIPAISDVYYLRDKADSGDAAAMLKYGYFLLYSHNVQRNADEAVNWFIKAAENGNWDALQAIRRCANDHDVKNAADTAKRHFEALVGNNHQLNCMYAFCCLENDMDEQTKERVFYLIKKASEAKFELVCNIIAKYLIKFNSQSLKDIYNYFEMAIAYKDYQACADYCRFKFNYKADLCTVKTQLMEAANAGNSDAYFWYGKFIYQYSTYSYQLNSQKEAAEWFFKAASGGSIAALQSLYICDLDSDFTHPDAAFVCSMLKYVQSYDFAPKDGRYIKELTKFNLGHCYKRGFGVPCDLNRACKIFEYVDKRGFPRAYISLGYMYENGYGSENAQKQQQMAFNYYMNAYNVGVVSAAFNIANCYSQGIGVTANPDKAMDFYEKAIKSGDAAAVHNLQVMYLQRPASGKTFKNAGPPSSKDLENAVSQFENAALKGFPEASYNAGVARLQAGNWEPQKVYADFLGAKYLPIAQNALGICNEFGVGVAADPIAAIDLYEEVLKGFGVQMPADALPGRETTPKRRANEVKAYKRCAEYQSEQLIKFAQDNIQRCRNSEAQLNEAYRNIAQPSQTLFNQAVNAYESPGYNQAAFIDNYIQQQTMTGADTQFPAENLARKQPYSCPNTIVFDEPPLNVNEYGKTISEAQAYINAKSYYNEQLAQKYAKLMDTAGAFHNYYTNKMHAQYTDISNYPVYTYGNYFEQASKNYQNRQYVAYSDNNSGSMGAHK